MIRALAPAAALCSALLSAGGPAFALSCLAPDPVRDFKEAHASEARWGAVVGRLDFDENRLPEVALEDQMKEKPPTDLRAQFVGHSLGPNGFDRVFQGNVTLRVSCIAAWCGKPQSGERYLAFLKHEDGKRVVMAEPCGRWLYGQPEDSVLEAIETCFAGGPCEAD
jgi:hypothetical protein